MLLARAVMIPTTLLLVGVALGALGIAAIAVVLFLTLGKKNRPPEEE